MATEQPKIKHKGRTMRKKLMTDKQLLQWEEHRKAGKSLYVAVYWVLIYSLAVASGTYLISAVTNLVTVIFGPIPLLDTTPKRLDELSSQFIMLLIFMMPANYFLGNLQWKENEKLYQKTIASRNLQQE
jgi:hypothetical protein